MVKGKNEVKLGEGERGKVDGGENAGKIGELRQRMARAKLELLAGKVKDVRTVRKLRKELARWLTRKREKELS